MFNWRIFAKIGMIVMSLFVTECSSNGTTYGVDYSTRYNHELTLSLGEYVLSNQRYETIESDSILYPDIKRTTWDVTFTDAEGVTQTFVLDNNLPFESSIYAVSAMIIQQRVMAFFDDRVGEEINLIGFDQVLLFPIDETHASLFPKNIAFSALPEEILIQVFPKDFAEVDVLVNRALQKPEVSFFVMIDGFNGIIIKNGTKLDRIYSQKEAFDFPDLPE